jgi:hypothetical protein
VLPFNLILGYTTPTPQLMFTPVIFSTAANTNWGVIGYKKLNSLSPNSSVYMMKYISWLLLLQNHHLGIFFNNGIKKLLQVGVIVYRNKL